MKNNRVLTSLLILQAGVIIGLVVDSVHVVPAAQAQMIPDPAGQQIQTNELLRGIDAKLAKLSGQLDGELHVRVANPSPEKK